MPQNGTMDKHLKKMTSFPTKKCLLLVSHACARQESSKVSNRLFLSHESPKKLPRPHFALSSQVPAFKWGKCRISKDLSGTLYATTPPHLHIGNRQLFLSTEPCVAWNAYPEFTRWFPSCYHGYSSNSQNDQSADAQLDWLDVSPAYVVGGSSWRVIDNEDSEDTTINLDNTQQTSNNDSIGSNSTYTTPAPDQDVTGSLDNDDGNGNGNGKKQQV